MSIYWSQKFVYVSESIDDKSLCRHNKYNDASWFSLFAHTMREKKWEKEKGRQEKIIFSLPYRYPFELVIFSVSLSVSFSSFFIHVCDFLIEALLEIFFSFVRQETNRATFLPSNLTQSKFQVFKQQVLAFEWIFNQRRIQRRKRYSSQSDAFIKNYACRVNYLKFVRWYRNCTRFTCLIEVIHIEETRIDRRNRFFAPGKGKNNK